MTRRVQPAQERLMFPAWSARADDLPNELTSAWRRRLDYKIWARRSLILTSVLTILWLVNRKAPAIDASLNVLLSRSEFKELGIAPYQRPQIRSDNPWRGAGRRGRKDLIMSVSGCGGSFRKALSVGDTASVRYSMRSTDGRLLDSSKGSADVLVGSGQVDEEMDRTLQGLCAGEAVRFRTKGGRRVLLYIERVGSGMKSVRVLENKLARLVKALPSRKGRSCKSTCGVSGYVCEVKGFMVVNNCPRLRETFGCVRCEVAAAGSSGPDMPALVVKSAPIGHARGACLVTPNAAGSRCDAKYAYTKRLCPCFEEGAVQRAMGKQAEHASKR